MLAPMLPCQPPLRWFSSTLSRAQDTAQTILAAWHKQHADSTLPSLCSMEDLKEQNFGQWEGEPYTRITNIPTTDLAKIRPPDGESFEDLSKRIVKAITHIQQNIGDQSSGDIVVVAHAGVIRCAIAHALDLSLDAALRIHIDHLSLSRIDHTITPAPDTTLGNNIDPTIPPAIKSTGNRYWSVQRVNDSGQYWEGDSGQ